MRSAFILGAALILAASCGTCGGTGGGKAASILGYWTFKGGVVQVTAQGAGFEGKIVTQPQSGACAEPIGYVLLKLKGSGNHYTGSEEWWTEPTCDRMYSDTAIIDVTGSTAHMCSKDPFPGGGELECVDLQRVQGPSGA